MKNTQNSNRFLKLEGIARSLIDLPNSRKKHFSFLMIRNKVVAFGINNSFKTDPLANKFGTRFDSIHSELALLKTIGFSKQLLQDCDWFNLRILPTGGFALAKPCKFCVDLLQYFGVREVWYTTGLYGNWQKEIL